MNHALALEVLGGPMDGVRLNLPKDLTVAGVGRQVGNNMTLPFDMTISRWHATIKKEGLDYYLVDEKSVSGTWLNGERVEKIKIKPGMIFLLGGTIIEVIEQPLPDNNVVLEIKYFENPATIYRFSDQLTSIWRSLFSEKNEKKYCSITGFFQQPAFYKMKKMSSYKCIQRLCRSDSRTIVANWINQCDIQPRYRFLHENLYLTSPRMWHVLDIASSRNTKEIDFSKFIDAVLDEKKSLAARIILKDNVFIQSAKHKFQKKEKKKQVSPESKMDPIQELLLSSLEKFETIIAGFIEDALNAGMSRRSSLNVKSNLNLEQVFSHSDQTLLRNHLKKLEKNLVAVLAAHRDSLRIFEKELGNRISAVLKKGENKGLFPISDSDHDVSKAVKSVLKESELEGLSDRIVRQAVKNNIIP